MPKNRNGPDAFSSIHRRGPDMQHQAQRPPALVEPDGKRYSLYNRQVSYLGWQFNLRMSTLSGPQLFDVRFRGDRIAYEISLQELVVIYSAHNPMHQVADVADSASYLGTMAKSLVPGADCPESSTFISNTLAGQLIKGPVRFPNVWCMFEHTSSLPLRRHMAYGFVHGSFYGGMMDSHLTLRTVLTFGNYDYVVDFSFHQNGLMDVQIASTGYLMVSPYSKEDSNYGFRVQDHIIGNLHHHLFHFKVDMDVGGSTENRYSTLDIHKDKTLLTSDRRVTYYQTKIKQSLKSKERNALYKYNFEKPAYHIVHNNNNKTRFDEMRGYR
ncbi:amine oxidase [Elysia marginata]|uniref:Amine oxidase n=1 Tax=Elysia marginata TaxID=1093978 RepID=A0AAV4HR84_9GAST|nr:amine oxidase [Elysia marginata]